MSARLSSLLLGTLFLGATLASASCSSPKSEPKSASDSLRAQLELDESGAAPALENVQTPVTQLERAAVVRTIDEGLGRFLGNFIIEGALDEYGEFQGFRIVKLRDPELFRGVGIQAGDVVTSINEKPIERPNQAYEAFIALKTADSLDIAYLRSGRKMRLSLPIVGEAPSENRKSATSKKSGAAPAMAASSEKPEAAKKASAKPESASESEKKK